MIEHIIVQMEQERGLDRAAAIADMRFHFIKAFVSKQLLSRAKARSTQEVLKLIKYLRVNTRLFRHLLQ